MQTNPQAYGITEETANKALAYMKVQGYIPEEYTVEDLIDYTRSMVEGIPFMVKSKINQWANS